MIWCIIINWPPILLPNKTFVLASASGLLNSVTFLSTTFILRRSFISAHDHRFTESGIYFCYEQRQLKSAALQKACMMALIDCQYFLWGHKGPNSVQMLLWNLPDCNNNQALGGPGETVLLTISQLVYSAAQPCSMHARQMLISCQHFPRT